MFKIYFCFFYQARLNQQVVLQGHPEDTNEIKTENLSEINNDESVSKDNVEDVPMVNTDSQLDQHLMDTLMKNPTSDVHLDNIHSTIFSENIAPVTAEGLVDLPLTSPPSGLHVEPHISASPISMPQETNMVENSTSSWNHNSLSINDEVDGLNLLLKADKNLNEMNSQSSEGNALQTPMADNKLIPSSADLAPISEAITPSSSLSLPLISPVEAISSVSKDTPLSVSTAGVGLDSQPKDINPVASPAPTSPAPTAHMESESTPPKVSLESPYEVPKICLLMDENAVPKLPPRPPPTPVGQLYPPTPSITVSI